MDSTRAEPYRDIDFSRAKRGAVVPPVHGKTRISIRLDDRVLEHFRDLVDTAGGGNYQTLINEALVAHIEGQPPGCEVTPDAQPHLRRPPRA